MIKGIRHIGIVVRDIEKSIRFYKKYFGFEVNKDVFENTIFIEKLINVPGAKLRTVKMKSPVSEVLVELIHYIEGKFLENNNSINQVGPNHFAVTVKDVNELYKTMLADGIHFLSTPTNSPDKYAKVVFCCAPEGTLIEMVELLK